MMTMKPYIENIENILPIVVKMKPYIENILSSLLTLEGLQLVWCLVTQSGKRDHCTIGLSYFKFNKYEDDHLRQKFIQLRDLKHVS